MRGLGDLFVDLCIPFANHANWKSACSKNKSIMKHLACCKLTQIYYTYSIIIYIYTYIHILYYIYNDLWKMHSFPWKGSMGFWGFPQIAFLDVWWSACVVGEQWLLLLGSGSMARCGRGPYGPMGYSMVHRVSMGILEEFYEYPQFESLWKYMKIWNHPLLLGYYMIILEYEYLG